MLRCASALLAAATLCLSLAACGSGDDSSGGAKTETAKDAKVAKPSKGAITFETTEPSEDEVAIEGPAAVEAGVTRITLRNSGTRPHDAQIVRVLNDLRTTDQVISNSVDAEEGAPLPYWITDGGGLGTVAPGESATVTERLEPGTYYAFDTERPEGSDTLNALRGGVAKFEVVGYTDAPLYSTRSRITARDYRFRTAGIERGPNRVTFYNGGQEPHHLIAARLVGDATPGQARDFLRSGKSPGGQPPVDLENSIRTAMIDGGQRQIMRMDFEPGRYALLCFTSDRDGGPPHVEKGMVGELNVE